MAKVRLSASLSRSRDTVVPVVHPYNTDILHSPAHPLSSLIPF